MPLKRFLALDIGASSVKFGEFTSTGTGNLSLVNFGIEPLPVLDPAIDENRNPAVVAALKKIMTERQIKARNVAVSVSGQVVLTRFMKLPATDETKIRQMVRYEAAQNVPFPIEEVVWDFQVLGGKGEAELDVVLVAIKSEIVEEISHCVGDAGLDVEVVDVAPVALYNAVRYNYDFDGGCTLVLDIGARTTNLIFIEGKKVFMRNVPIAGNTISQNVAQELEIQFSEADELKMRQGFVGLGGAYEEPEIESAAKLSKIIRNVMTRLHADVARSINFYKIQQGGTAPKRLLLSGGSSIISYADYFFKEKMEIEVEYINPFKNVPFQVPAAELEKVAHSMGEVVGLGLRLETECPIEVNLVPVSIIRQRDFKRKTPFFVLCMIGVICMVWANWLYYWKAEALLNGHLDLVNRDVELLKRIDEDMKKAEKDMAASHVYVEQIRRIIEGRTRWVEFLNKLNATLPPDIWITELNPGNDGKQILYSGSLVQSAMAGRGGRGAAGGPGGPGGPTPDAQTSFGKTIVTEFEIRGLCINNPKSSDPTKPIQDFRTNLEKSGLFSADIKVLSNIVPAPADWTFEFRFRARLKKEQFLDY